MWSSVIFAFLCSPVFCDTLTLKTGDTLLCEHFIEVLKTEERYFLCNEDTIYPQQIYSRKNQNGTFPYIDEVFLQKTISGRLSFYTGIKDEFVWEEISKGFRDPDLNYIRKKTNVLYYSFDSVTFSMYNHLRRNRLLADNLKENAKAFSYYRRHRSIHFIGAISANAFAVPLLLGLLKYPNDKRMVPLTITGAAGILLSTCITVTVPGKLINKAVACYNSN